jgi:hypothetical protein
MIWCSVAEKGNELNTHCYTPSGNHQQANESTRKPSLTHTAIHLLATTNKQIKAPEASCCNILRPHYTSIPVALEKK